jgi:ABC-2 type transport system ATP-binding protein
MNLVEIQNVTKTFGAHVAVDDLSLNVPQGCIYGFIGPNGSGKTTTLRMIMNIIYPDRGQIRVFGEQANSACSNRIGYLPEERGLYKKMKVRSLLRFYGGLKNGKDIPQEVDRWLEKLELSKWASKKVDTLSKGMTQKVQFIAAVVARPKIIILDEPFSGLDPVNTDVIREAVLELQAKGTTIIFSTHDMSVAENMCDFIFMIFKGQKVLDGPLSDIQDQYGADTIKIRIDGPTSALQNIPGVTRVKDHGQTQELRINGKSNSQEILQTIMSRAHVRHFEISKPSLHDIFVRIAGPSVEDQKHA